MSGQQQIIGITGMRCAGCVGRVERALQAVPGVSRAEVSLATGRAVVALAGPAGAVVQAVRDTGFQAELLADPQALPQPESESRADRAVTLGALALGAALLLPMAGVALPAWLQFCLALPVQLAAGAVFYQGAWRALRHGDATMDTLVALGSSAAFLFSLWQWAAGGPLYFEAAALVVALVRLGRWLEGRARQATNGALYALASLRPERARVERDGAVTEIAAALLAPSDVVVVRPGERLPADGVVIGGVGECDESLLTGESRPVPKQVGDRTIGGALNGTGLLRVRVTEAGADSVLARITALVAAAQSGKPPIQRVVDRVAGVFVPAVLVLAAVTWAGWAWAGQGAAGLIAAVSVLVIACPCALGLATPVALVAALGAAARAGILVRDPAALESVRRIRLVAFDKTGTLTAGKPRVVSVHPNGISADALLQLAASAEQGSEHPIAQALLDAAAGQDLLRLDSFTARPGQGLSATVAGRGILVGTAALIGTAGAALDRAADALRQQLEGEGCTVLLVAEADRCLGMIALRDTLRPESRNAVDALHRLGLRTALLTGDNAAVAQDIACALGIADVRAALLPDAKLRAIGDWQRQGVAVAMVGDGINDAPALAAAGLGIAMGGGADAAIGAAAITLLHDDPGLVAATLRLGRFTWRIVCQNLAWACLFNLLGIPLAMAGRLNPMIAGGAMAFSSVLVVCNALRLRRWHP